MNVSLGSVFTNKPKRDVLVRKSRKASGAGAAGEGLQLQRCCLISGGMSRRDAYNFRIVAPFSTSA